MEAGSEQSNETYRNHLVSAYLQRAGAFRKIFASLLAFTGAFAFFIAWPFLSAAHQEHSLNREITDIKAELKQLSAQHARYQIPKQNIQALNKMIEGGPSLLRAYIEAINAERPFSYPAVDPACKHLTDPAQTQISLQSQQSEQYQIPQQMQQQQQQMQRAIRPAADDACAQGSDQDRTICRIDRFVQYELCGYEQVFRHRVLSSLAELTDQSKALFDQAELDQQFGAVREALHKHIEVNPAFWRTYEGKGEVSVELQSKVKRLWSDISARTEPVTKDLAQRIERANQRQKELKEAGEGLAEQRDELQERLAEIQSPIGNLPIGLTESVLMFPILLVIGFGMVTSGFLEQLRLRRRLMSAEAEGGASGDTLKTGELARVAPLWIDPAESGQRKLPRWLLLLVPPLAFLATVVSITVNEATGDSTLFQQAGPGEWVYWLLYAASALAFGLCLWLMWMGLRGLEPEKD